MMNVKEFLERKVKTYLETREDDVSDLKEKLSERDYYNNEIQDLQNGFDQDWKEWVEMDPDYDDFNEEEKEEIEDHDLFTTTPINVWNIWENM